MYPVLITWGFEQRSGKVELEVFLDLTVEDSASNVRHVYTRAQFTNTNVSLFHLPDGATREDLQVWFEFTEKKELIEKLNKSIVRQDQVVRKKHEGSNSLDFILGGK